MLLHHVWSCLLSLIAALQCLVKIREAVKELLFEELPKNGKNIYKNENYPSIKKPQELKEVDVEIEFLIIIKPGFDMFMTKF